MSSELELFANFTKNGERLFDFMQKLFQSHPWHGISSESGLKNHFNVYIEIVPTDTFKYEVDKKSGILRVDRPQKYSNVCPQMYGFIPQTYCMESVAELCQLALKDNDSHIEINGDGDPLDICVLSERPVPGGNVLVSARPIGGLRMIDKDEADDKIIAVLQDDVAYKHLVDIRDCPSSLVSRLTHYFLTYKMAPGSGENVCRIPQVYGAEEAMEVIKASMRDYDRYHPGLREVVRREAV
jgi:inorganic pyrophosphatase